MKKLLLFFFSKSFLFSYLLSVAYISSFAQIPISGTIKDVKKQPIPGVSVILKGSSFGTVSDVKGEFKLNLSTKDGILVFSSIGYNTMEVKISNQNTIDIEMTEDSKALNEVVVTALGIKKDIRRIGVAIQSVDGASVIKAREPNAINALAGKVAGLTIGAQPELLRRPNISLRGNRDVLFVVDGVPVNSDT